MRHLSAFPHPFRQRSNATVEAVYPTVFNGTPLDVIADADWIIDLGSLGANAKFLAQG